MSDTQIVFDLIKKHKYDKATKLAIQNGFILTDWFRLPFNNVRGYRREFFKVFWRIGRELSRNKEYAAFVRHPKNSHLLPEELHDICTKTFIHTQERVCTTVFCWLLIGKRAGLVKDVVVLIAKMVWKCHRKNPSLWINLKKNAAKKIKLKK